MKHEDIGHVLLRLTQDFHERLQAHIEAHGTQGIRGRHRRVFMYIALNGPSRSVDLAAAVGIRPQSMMTLVQELEALGFVWRETDPGDSRAKLIDLTPSGKRLLRELAKSTEAVWDEYVRIGGEALVSRLFGDMETLLTRIARDADR